MTCPLSPRFGRRIQPAKGASISQPFPADNGEPLRQGTPAFRRRGTTEDK